MNGEVLQEKEKPLTSQPLPSDGKTDTFGSRFEMALGHPLPSFALGHYLHSGGINQTLGGREFFIARFRENCVCSLNFCVY
jgi:hypothetical protein